METQIYVKPTDYNNIGYEILDRKIDFGFAAELFEKAIAIDPSIVNAWLNLQNCFLASGKLEAAKDIGNRALKHHPHDPRLCGNMSKILNQLGDYNGLIDFVMAKSSEALGNTPTEAQKQELTKSVVSALTHANVPNLDELIRYLKKNSSSDGEKI